MGLSPVFATSREMAALSLFRMTSPDAGKSSPGIMSARHPGDSAQHRESAHRAQGDLSDRASGEDSNPDPGCMKPSGGEQETGRIWNDTGRWRFGPMGVAMKECEQGGGRRTQPDRGSHRERDEQP